MTEFRYNGMRVVSSPLATSRAAVIERMPIAKRRRRWRLRYEQRPAAFIIDAGPIGLSGGRQLVIHPTLMALLRTAANGAAPPTNGELPSSTPPDLDAKS